MNQKFSLFTMYKALAKDEANGMTKQDLFKAVMEIGGPEAASDTFIENLCNEMNVDSHHNVSIEDFEKFFLSKLKLVDNTARYGEVSIQESHDLLDDMGMALVNTMIFKDDFSLSCDQYMNKMSDVFSAPKAANEQRCFKAGLNTNQKYSLYVMYKTLAKDERNGITKEDLIDIVKRIGGSAAAGDSYIQDLYNEMNVDGLLNITTEDFENYFSSKLKQIDNTTRYGQVSFQESAHLLNYIGMTHFNTLIFNDARIFSCDNYLKKMSQVFSVSALVTSVLIFLPVVN